MMLSESNESTNGWAPTGLQSISTYQYRDGEQLVTRHKIVDEFENGVQPYYKNPLAKPIDLSGIINETFDNEENENRLASFRHNQHNNNHYNLNYQPSSHNLSSVVLETEKRIKL